MLLSVLTIIFVVLKLTHLIAWSWWLVVSPLIVQAVIWLVVVGGITALALKKYK